MSSLDLAQYRELITFTQFGSELDKTTQAQLTRGERMVELLKQGQYEPLTISKQVMIIYAGTNGFLDELPVSSVRKFELGFYKYMDERHNEIVREIEDKKVLSDELKRRLDEALNSFKEEFKKLTG